jgi:transcriptional regulator of arginine metabolism
MKTARLRRIQEIITEHNISRQDELIAYLAKDGFNSTQATLSRDLAELGVRKTRENGSLRYVQVKQSEMQNSFFAAGIRSVKTAANIAVIVCSPGTAAAVCIQIDNMNIKEAVGTIAGDDTIFIACESAEAAKRFTARLKNLIG